MAVINVDSTLEFVVELPCKKVLLFSRIDKDRVYAEVFPSREQFDLASRGWKLAPNATRIKRRTFWLAEELANLRYAICGLQQALWYESPHNVEPLSAFVELGRKLKGIPDDDSIHR